MMLVCCAKFCSWTSHQHQVSVTQGQSCHVTEVMSTDLTKSKVMMRVRPFLEIHSDWGWHVQKETECRTACWPGYSHGQTNTTNPISQQPIIFFVIWFQILAWLAEIRWETCLPSFSHELFRVAIFLAYKYSPNSGSWVTKFTSKWLMMKLNCCKWFVWQQQCPWLPVSNNFW